MAHVVGRGPGATGFCDAGRNRACGSSRMARTVLKCRPLLLNTRGHQAPSGAALGRRRQSRGPRHKSV